MVLNMNKAEQVAALYIYKAVQVTALRIYKAKQFWTNYSESSILIVIIIKNKNCLLTLMFFFNIDQI